MSDLKVLKCPSCGSSSIEKVGSATAKCSYCGSVFQLNSNTLQKSEGSHSRRLVVVILMSVIFAVILIVRVNNHIPVSEFSSESPVTETKPKLDIPQINLKSNIPQINSKNLVITDQQIDKPDMTPKVTVVKNISASNSIGGKYWIVTIRNDGKTNIARPGALVSLYDNKGQRVEEQKGWSKLEHLAPKQQTEVLILVSKPPLGEYKTEITAFAQLPGMYDTYQDSLEVQNFVIKPENKYSNRVSVIGDIRNPMEYQVDYVVVVALAQNSEGEVVGIADGYVSSTHIASGETSGFKVSAGTYISEKPESWSVYALGKKHRNLIQ